MDHHHVSPHNSQCSHLIAAVFTLLLNSSVFCRATRFQINLWKSTLVKPNMLSGTFKCVLSVPWSDRWEANAAKHKSRVTFYTQTQVHELTLTLMSSMMDRTWKLSTTEYDLSHHPVQETLLWVMYLAVGALRRQDAMFRKQPADENMQQISVYDTGAMGSFFFPVDVRASPSF